MEQTDATVRLSDYIIWYRVRGDLHTAGATPVLLLHGGPGVVSDYMFPCQDILADLNIPSIIFDQVGNGRSSHFPEKRGDDTFWTIDFFKTQVRQMIAHLKLETYHIWGHSWGGILANELLTDSHGLPGAQRLVLHSSLADTGTWFKEANRLRTLLPKEVQGSLTRHEQNGTTDSEEYKQGTMIFYSLFVCRLDPPPQVMLDTFEWMEKDPTVSLTMMGPSEFYSTGSLKNWSIKDRLHKISLPTLILHGEHDEATELVTRELAAGIKGASVVEIPSSSHMSHLEQPQRVQEAIRNFLT